MSLRKRKLGLALGGGGARGLSHIGVLQSLEREHIPVDLLVGTSIGALVGGAFCCGLSAIELEQRVAEYLESKEFESSAMKAFETAHGKQELAFHQKVQRFLKNRYYMVQALFRPGLLSQEDFQVTINHFIPDILIQQTRIPFRAVATDLISGDPIVFSEGSLRQALAASCAVPGAVAPLKEGDRLLSDGGIICNIPVSVARREGADVVIAVPVDRDACSESECDTVLGIYFRASEIMAYQLQTMELQKADIVIRPNVGNLHWSSFSQARDLISEGGSAVDEKLDQIRTAVFGLKGWLRTLPERIRKATFR